jgi:dTDP-4-dehydrorhamnose 3,5-epimerase
VLFSETALPGVWIVAPEPKEDFGGFFARTWCEREFAAAGIHERWVQSSISFTKKKGTVRGMHYRRPPHADQIADCSGQRSVQCLVLSRPWLVHVGQWQPSRKGVDDVFRRIRAAVVHDDDAPAAFRGLEYDVGLQDEGQCAGPVVRRHHHRQHVVRRGGWRRAQTIDRAAAALILLSQPRAVGEERGRQSHAR